MSVCVKWSITSFHCWSEATRRTSPARTPTASSPPGERRRPSWTSRTRTRGAAEGHVDTQGFNAASSAAVLSNNTRKELEENWRRTRPRRASGMFCKGPV
ncbi:Uncharacterized protein DAT39_022618 [Clarias magur]|uniref:Uncharacterized protein n=1 Tax=Clarias magur TaxID=1594786 RepID=A0A8J4T2B8_CLAMG|nr:Uncharacterized protein DAT39_022618 [Clarias magur]